MREHEVPTHVQAEDNRVLLWFTFPQVVAVCALSYGAYRYAPVGPSEVRMALAVLLGLAGIAAVVGQIGGRRLSLVAADLLKYRLGARRYAGPSAELVRSEPPAPVQPADGGPGPLRLMARKARRGLRKLRKKTRQEGERRKGRMPFRSHRWFGKPRRTEVEKDTIKGNGNGAGGRKARRRKPPKSFLVVVAVVVMAATVGAVPQVTLADSPDDGEGWSSDEIEFRPPQPVEGRRLFIEGLSVTADRAAVTLRAATALDIRVRAFGGPEGSWLRFWGSASLNEGEQIDYSLPLHGPNPSFTISWEDTLGQAGALTVKHEHIPHPLPAIDGELCDLRITSLGWTPGAVSGVIESECAAAEEAVELQTVAGHADVTETALMDAEVTAITGMVDAATGASQASVTFIPNGLTRFQLGVPTSEAIHAVTVDVSLEATLRIPIPPLTQLTHHPERTELRSKTVSLWRPGTSETVSETVTTANPDGSTTERVLSATLSIPGETVYRDVTLTIVHPEHVKAEVVERSPITGSRDETLALASSVRADDPFNVLVLPEPEPEPETATQTPADGDPASGAGQALSHWFEALGWEWPW